VLAEHQAWKVRGIESKMFKLKAKCFLLSNVKAKCVPAEHQAWKVRGMLDAILSRALLVVLSLQAAPTN
jgi:hypothetical protein